MNKDTRKRKVLLWIGRVMITFLVTLVILCGGLYGVMRTLTHGPSTIARKQFIMSLLETGALKFMAGWFATEEEIKVIVEENSDYIFSNSYCRCDFCPHPAQWSSQGL